MRHLVVWVLLAVCLCGLDAGDRERLVREIILHECAIPFIYGDDVYHSCTAVRIDFDGCSLDHVYRGRCRYCTATDPPKCTFPFTFKQTTFEQCTKEHYVLDRSWCSLTCNYNTDRKWKQCSPLH
ncbi:binder of sperm protein homolog 2-like [Marmota flaviventris]|uniref:binder of sperm protein homolog 2-like n=1 Tax=Marmota flaviventris TaxID=93162 RepID=UPI003A893F35